MLKCLECHNEIHKTNSGFFCDTCRRRYSLDGGIFRFLNDGAEADFYPEEGFDILYKSEANNFWFRARNLIIGHNIKAWMPFESKILEVGCGTGFVSSYLKEIGYNVDCADFSIQGLNYCKKRDAGKNYFQFNLYDAIFHDHYDAICAFDVIEHIDDDLLVLRNMNKALKSGGFIFITVPANKKLWSETDEFAKHKRRYDIAELREKVEGEGFEIVRISYFMTFLFPFLYVSRFWMKQRLSNDNIKMIDELNLNPVLDSIFYYIFKAESYLLNYISYPFGCSLLCVAKKVGN